MAVRTFDIAVRRALVVAVGLLATLAVPPSHAAPAAAEVTLGPLVSGTQAYVHGTFVWTDYAYNDHGPDRAATYPSPDDQNNAADLIQLQLGLGRRGGLSIRAVLETLTHKDIPLLGVGLDTDNDSRTGASSVPGGQWKNAGSLGLDLFVTVSSRGAALNRWTGHGWQLQQALAATVDLASNVMSAEIPGLRLGHRVSAVTVLGLGRADSSWLTGKGPIYNLAFVHAEPPATGNQLASAEQVAITGKGHATGGEWQDRRQGEVLTGKLPATTAVAVLDVDAMRRHVTRLPDVSSPGQHVWMYHSRVALPEGIIDGTAAGGLWAGPYQPYVVQVPAKPDRSALLWLHGGGANHLANGVFAPQGSLRLNRALGIFPFGRQITTTQDHGYHFASEQDVLDVLADASRNYRLDARRVVVAGLSTGGGGASRMAQLHPDLFSGVLVSSAYDDTHLIENLVNVPLVLHNGAADPAASQPVLALTVQELDALGDVDYRSYSVAAHTHADMTADLTQCVLDRLLATAAVQRPARVVLTLDPLNDAPGLDLRHGDAYWVSDAALRPGPANSPFHTAAGDPPGYGDNAVGRVDLSSLAVARRTTTATSVEAVGENVTSGADFCGPSTSAHSNDLWRVHGLALRPAAPQPVSNAVRGVLRRVSGVGIDLATAQLSAARPLRLDLDGDGMTTVRLLGAWPSRAVGVVRDGVRVGTARARRGVLTLRLDAQGQHTFMVW